MALGDNFLGDLIAATQGGTVEPNAFGLAVNAGAQLPDSGALPTRMMTQADMPAPVSSAPVQQPSGQPRRSILDMIGGIADTIATVGGATPLYQPNLDAREARANARDDRTRAIDIEALKKRQLEQSIRSGDQSIQMGGLELQNARNELVAGAGAGMRQIFGRAGADGVLKAWPLLAQQLGVPPEQAAQIGEALKADPQGTLDALFPDPLAAKTSKAKEVQLYELIASEGSPEMADAYLKSLTDPKAMSAKEIAMLELAREKFAFDKYKFANPQQKAPTPTQQKAAEADNAREAGRTALTATLDELSGLYDQLNEMGAMVNSRQGTGANIAARARASGVGQLVEGAVGTEAQSLRDRVESIRPGLMQQIAKATGMTGKQLDSNADVKLFMQTVTDPTRSYDANRRAIAGLRRLLTQPPPAAAPKAAPAPGRTAPQQRKILSVTDAASYAKVPKGARFRDKDGNIRVKQ